MKLEDCRVIRETQSAILVESSSFLEQVWVPKSQITDDSEVYKSGTEGDLIVTEWFAKKKGWL